MFDKGTRVERADRPERTGVILPGGSMRYRLVQWDDGGREYVDVEKLVLSDSTPPPPPPPPPPPAAKPARGRPSWNKELILERLRDWAERHDGRPPVSKEWEQGDTRYPTAATVKKYFGSWSKALIEAGFPPPKRGQHGGARQHKKQPISVPLPAEIGPGRTTDKPPEIDGMQDPDDPDDCGDPVIPVIDIPIPWQPEVLIPESTSVTVISVPRCPVCLQAPPSGDGVSVVAHRCGVDAQGRIYSEWTWKG